MRYPFESRSKTLELLSQLMFLSFNIIFEQNKFSKLKKCIHNFFTSFLELFIMALWIYGLFISIKHTFFKNKEIIRRIDTPFDNTSKIYGGKNDVTNINKNILLTIQKQTSNSNENYQSD